MSESASESVFDISTEIPTESIDDLRRDYLDLQRTLYFVIASLPDRTAIVPDFATIVLDEGFVESWRDPVRCVTVLRAVGKTG